MYKIVKTINDILNFDSISGFGISKNNLINIVKSVVIGKVEATNIFNVGQNCIILDQLNKPYLYLNDTLDDSLYNIFRVSKVKFPYLNFYTKESPRQYGIYDLNVGKILFKT